LRSADKFHQQNSSARRRARTAVILKPLQMLGKGYLAVFAVQKTCRLASTVLNSRTSIPAEGSSPA
jgi:hypothetical protein